MKLFEWISTAYLRERPRPPYVFQRHNQVAATAVSVASSAVIPNDADYHGSIGASAAGTGGQVPVHLQLSIQVPGSATDFNVAFFVPSVAGETRTVGFIEELYVPRGSTILLSGSFSAGVAANYVDLMLFGFAIPPANVL